jgi:hypothetical protein
MAVSLNMSLNGHATRGAAQAGTDGQAAAKPTTIVGCLVDRLPADAGGRAAGANSGGDYFVRTPTVKIPAGTSVAVGKPGTTSTATSIGTPAGFSFYRIAGLTAEQLRPHVGHRVQVQGRLTDNMPGVESKRATTTQDKDGRATTTVETRIEIAGVLHATSVEMVSAECQQ